MGIAELIGPIVGILTIIGMIVGVTNYITQFQYKIKQERLELEKEYQEKKFQDLEAKQKDLLDQLAVALRSGTIALAQKERVDEELIRLMKFLRARAGSIYIPLRSKQEQEPTGLVFLSIQPYGLEAATLKKKVIPMLSFAGRCLTSGLPFVRSNATNDPDHFDKADKISGYQTQDVLNYPLRYNEKVVAVLQLLNKEGSEKFDEKDITRVEPFAPSISEKVYQFTQMPGHLEILGVTLERDTQYATVMFCDLTRSSILFREFSTPIAIQHLNEFFERICDIAFRYGATVDKYMGDGVIFRFNVPRPVEDHPLKALHAAIEIEKAFEKLKRDWVIMEELVGDIYIRTGISFGSVYQAEVGHPQYRYLTIFGQPVNVAVNLCEVARRDKNVIVMDDQFYQKISTKVEVNSIPKDKLGKVSASISNAYELKG